jgi:hypothetical protein
MSLQIAPDPTRTFGSDVLAHLDAQIASAQRLLATCLQQGAAIRARDVEAVLRKVAELQTEMERRTRLETHRAQLLLNAAQKLGAQPQQLTLEDLARLMNPNEAATARRRSAELKGLLAEVAREHIVNRALMRQELAFLDHLVRLIDDEPQTGYSAPTAPSPATRPATVHRIFDSRV